MSKRSKDKFFKRTCGDFDMAISGYEVSVWYDTVPLLIFSLDNNYQMYELLTYEVNEPYNHDIVVGIDDNIYER